MAVRIEKILAIVLYCEPLLSELHPSRIRQSSWPSSPGCIRLLQTV
jgi:hypothetical protein